jgi:lipopolysaccharide biosynthesis protein
MARWRRNRAVWKRLRKKPLADTAVIVHLYYPDVWPVIRESLIRLQDVPSDLFITLPTQQRHLAATIKADFAGASIFEVPNRGRDVAPFLYVASRVIGLRYEYVLKVHSKKSVHRDALHGWLQDILTTLLPAERDAHTSIMETLRRPDTGLIGPKDQYFTLPFHYEDNRNHLRRILAVACSEAHARKVDQHVSDYGYFAGTMFWARMDAIASIVRQDFRSGDFEEERGQIDSTLAHGLERAFSLVPEINHRSMYEIGPKGIERIEYQTDKIPEWSLLYRLRSGHDLLGKGEVEVS